MGVRERERLAPGNSLHLISWETDHALEVPRNRCACNSSCAPRLPRTRDALEVIRIEDKPEGSIFWEWIERPSLLILPRRMTVVESLEVMFTAGPTEAANCHAAPLLSRWAAGASCSQGSLRSRTGEQMLWPLLGSFLQEEKFTPSKQDAEDAPERKGELTNACELSVCPALPPRKADGDSCLV